MTQTYFRLSAAYKLNTIQYKHFNTLTNAWCKQEAFSRYEIFTVVQKSDKLNFEYFGVNITESHLKCLFPYFTFRKTTKINGFSLTLVKKFSSQLLEHLATKKKVM